MPGLTIRNRYEALRQKIDKGMINFKENRR